MKQPNIVNRALLKILLLASPLYKKAGANIKQLEQVLYYKLLMDDRRPNTMQQNSKKNNDKPAKVATLGSMLMALLLGCLLIIVFFVTKDPLTSFTFFFSVYIVMLALTLIADFTNVLIDVRDNFIILPKPISDATFVIARLLHITIHVSKIMLPMALPAMITAAIMHGIFSVLPFFVMIIASVFFTIFLINALYLLILRVTSPERFKNIISYIQIAFAILVYGGYQIVPRLIEKTALKGTVIGYKPAWLLVPPFWFGSFMQQCMHATHSVVAWMATALALSMPVLGMVLVVRFFAPTFNQKLALISSGVSAPDQKVQTRQKKFSYSAWLAKVFTRSAVEKQAFLFSWRMMLRNRDYKLKVYPGIGYLIVIIGAMMLRSKNSIHFTDGLNLANGTASIFAVMATLYFTGLVTLTALGQFAYSEHFKASWIFWASPTTRPGLLIGAATKAVIAQFQLPIFMLISLALLAINGWHIIPHLVVAYANLLIIAAAVILTGKPILPWSAPITQQEKGTSVIKAFFTLFLLGFVAIVHGLLAKYLWAMAALAVASIFLSNMLFKNIARINWLQVKTAND
jgi:ABC-2 type transport system permease protein